MQFRCYSTIGNLRGFSSVVITIYILYWFIIPIPYYRFWNKKYCIMNLHIYPSSVFLSKSPNHKAKSNQMEMRMLRPGGIPAGISSSRIVGRKEVVSLEGAGSRQDGPLWKTPNPHQVGMLNLREIDPLSREVDPLSLLFRQSLFLFERILIKMARWIWGRLIHSRNLAGTACKGLCISFGWWWRFSSSTRVLRNSFQGFWFLSQRLNLFDLNVSFVWGRLRLQCQSTRRSIRKAAAHRRSWL